MKPTIYISGPYSADSLIDRQQNILNAKRRFVAALATGEWWAVCPHTHTAELEMHLPGVDHDEWLRMDITMLASCDAIWADYLKNKGSVGTRLELAWAILAGMPIHLGSLTPSVPSILRNNRRPDLIEPVYDELTEDREKIWAMAADGEIPDPEFYNGSVLTRGKNESD